MTAQDLKNAILQLAVHGKLVPQNQTETEIELRGIKLKPTDDLSFDIPQTWKTAHIECVCNTVPSKQYQILESEVRKSGQYPVISQSKEYAIGYTDAADKVFYHEKPVIAFGDHTTEVKYITFDFVVGADGVKLFEPNGEIVFPLFFYYVMQYYTIGLNKVGGYSRHYKYIKNKPIPLPPLAEQKRIVAKIKELMPLVEEYGKAEERLTALNADFPDKLRKSILQQAIQGKLTERDPSDEPASELLKRIRAEKDRLVKEGKIKKDRRTEELGVPSVEDITFDIPIGWECVYLGSILNKLTDGTHKTPKYTNSGVKFVSVKDMSNGVLSLEKTKYISEKEHNELYLRCDPMRGDMLLSKVGTTGVPAIVDTDEPFSLFVSVALLKYNHSCINEQFFYYLLQSPLVQEQAEFNTRGAGNKNWVLDAIAKTIIVIPPLAEQQRIVDRVNELLALCDELK